MTDALIFIILGAIINIVGAAIFRDIIIYLFEDKNSTLLGRIVIIILLFPIMIICLLPVLISIIFSIRARKNAIYNFKMFFRKGGK